MTATGIDSSDPVATLAKGSSMRRFRPGFTVTPPIVMSSFRFESGIDVVFHVSDDRPRDIDAASAFDSFQSR